MTRKVRFQSLKSNFFVTIIQNEFMNFVEYGNLRKIIVLTQKEDNEWQKNVPREQQHRNGSRM